MSRPRPPPSPLINRVAEYKEEEASGIFSSPSGLIDDDLEKGVERLRAAAPLDRYVDGIVKRLLAAYPHPAPEITVAITTEMNYVGETQPNGVIRIGQGTLVNCDSEDELAWILAHEMAHVLLDHHKTRGYSNHLNQMHENEQGMQLVSESDGRVDGRATFKPFSRLVTVLARTTVLGPWDREMERNADMLGTDLFIRAGYNRAAIRTVFERFEADEKKAREAKTASYAKAATSNGLAGVFGVLMSAPVVLVEELASDQTAEHPDPKERLVLLNRYMRNYAGRAYRAKEPVNHDGYRQAVLAGPGGGALYDSLLIQRAQTFLKEGDEAQARGLFNAVVARAPSHSEARFGLFILDMKANNPESAEKHLWAGIKDEKASPLLYSRLIELQVQRDDLQGALTTTRMCQARYPDLAEALEPTREKLLAEMAYRERMKKDAGAT